MESMTKLQWPDYLILVGFLLISLGIGVYHSLTGGRQKTTQEFIMANRRLGVLPTAMSLFVSFQSAIMILGCTAEMYLFGAQYLVWIPVSFVISIIVCERLMLPWIYPLKLVSINDYLEQRYESKAVRIFGAVINILGGIMYMGTAMYAPSAALETATGLPTTVSIPLMAIVSVAYTALGGMRAVIWTDVFQFITMMGGMIAIFVKGLVELGGYGKVMEICDKGGRLDYANWSPDPSERHTVWNLVIGNMIGWTGVYGLSQASVQRYSAVESPNKARLMLLLNIPPLVLSYFLVCSIGLTVYAYYSYIQCDPIVNKDVTNPNQLLSLFVTTIFKNAKGFSGLFLATLYGGALSSVSSSLSGAAANCWDDILKLKLSGMQENRKAIFNRMLVVMFGILATGVAFLAATIPGPIIQVAITFGSAVYGPLMGIFVMGGVTRLVHWKGALAGGIGSLCINIWYNTFSQRLHRELPILPYSSTTGCSVLNNTLPVNASMSDIWWQQSNTTSFDVFTTTPSFIDHLNQTSIVATQSSVQSEIVGFQKIYTLSYLYYSLMGLVNCVIIGLIVSLIFRDRKAESRVEKRLLIPFHRILRWDIVVPASNDRVQNVEPSDGKQSAAINGADLEMDVSGSGEKDINTNYIKAGGNYEHVNQENTRPLLNHL